MRGRKFIVSLTVLCLFEALFFFVSYISYAAGVSSTSRLVVSGESVYEALSRYYLSIFFCGLISLTAFLLRRKLVSEVVSIVCLVLIAILYNMIYSEKRYFFSNTGEHLYLLTFGYLADFVSICTVLTLLFTSIARLRRLLFSSESTRNDKYRMTF